MVDGIPYEGSPSNMDELYEWLASRYAYENRMDDSKPLWQIMMLNDFQDGKSYVLSLMHHAIGDGASLTLALSNLFDDQQDDEMKKEMSQVVNRKRRKKNFGLLGNVVAVSTMARRFLGNGDSVNPLSKVSRLRSLGRPEHIPLVRQLSIHPIRPLTL